VFLLLSLSMMTSGTYLPRVENTIKKPASLSFKTITKGSPRASKEAKPRLMAAVVRLLVCFGQSGRRRETGEHYITSVTEAFFLLKTRAHGTVMKQKADKYIFYSGSEP